MGRKEILEITTCSSGVHSAEKVKIIIYYNTHNGITKSLDGTINWNGSDSRSYRVYQGKDVPLIRASKIFLTSSSL